MRKIFNWLYRHAYETWIFLAGACFESALWHLNKDNLGYIIFYISMGVLYLVNAKMEKRYGK